MTIYDSAAALPSGFVHTLASMPPPTGVLMCPPRHFAVLDVKNPFMAEHIGATDASRAQEQWNAVREVFQSCNMTAPLAEPLPDREDMVFCANPIFPGVRSDGEKICILSNMRYESRQREVVAYVDQLGKLGYEFHSVPAGIGFEGGGDAIWHPRRRLIWGGCGPRSRPEAYPHVAEAFDTPVLRLRLETDHFYHLDTCLCGLDERTALLYPSALVDESVELVRAVFQDVIEVPHAEALQGMACNACAVGDRNVVLQKGNEHTSGALRERGFVVHEVATDEFIKSGGSVYCMKCYLW
ncbi:MAG: dimethylarginine dimethylaminohydrolase family protein [Phycisphaerae bacterium]